MSDVRDSIPLTDLDLKQAMRDPRHEQHADYWVWWGGPFDPKSFGINAANMAIRKLR